jgi:hypothetical protein
MRLCKLEVWQNINSKKVKWKRAGHVMQMKGENFYDLTT